MPPESLKQEPLSRWPSVAKKTPPSRFQTVRLGTLGAFFFWAVSGWLTRSSMRDCGGGHASALWRRIAVHAQHNIAHEMDFAKTASISLAQGLSLPRVRDGACEKKFRPLDRWLDRR